ncbi:MAG: DUF4440 domain-containing protein [Cyclobacteriaceae bacterium]
MRSTNILTSNARIALILFSIPIFGNILYAQSDHGNDREAIKKTAEIFSANYVKGAYDELIDIYTDDAVLMPPGQEMIYGREHIYKFWTRDSLYQQVYHRTVSDRLEIVGDFAFDNGYWYSKANYNSQERPLYSGKYLIIWKRTRDGQWKMYHDAWNNRANGWEETEQGN